MFEPNDRIFNYYELEELPFYSFEILRSPFPLFRIDENSESSNLKEIESNNENFIKEKNIKYNLYPLYINWKKVESKKPHNIIYFNIFKLFGYFGEAIFTLLKDACPNNENIINHENFLYELNKFNRPYSFTQTKIKENEFFKKLINIYEDVISLIKNKIIVFKEITVFIIVLRLYEAYFLILKDSKKMLEVLKYQYLIISKLNDDEYKKIFDKYFKKLNRGLLNDISLFRKKYSFPKNKRTFINNIKRVYKNLDKL